MEISNILKELEEQRKVYLDNYYSSSNSHEENVKWQSMFEAMNEAIFIVKKYDDVILSNDR